MTTVHHLVSDGAQDGTSRATNHPSVDGPFRSGVDVVSSVIAQMEQHCGEGAWRRQLEEDNLEASSSLSAPPRRVIIFVFCIRIHFLNLAKHKNYHFQQVYQFCIHSLHKYRFSRIEKIT